MADTLVDLFNRALRQAGATAFVNEPYEGTPQSIAMLQLLRPAIDQTLRMQEWGFCRTVASAGAPLKTATGATPWSSTQPEPPWQYEYAYPADCMRLIRIMPQPPFTLLPRPYLMKVAYDVIGGTSQRVVLCDTPNAIFVYNFEVPDPANWDPLFAELVVKTMAEQYRATEAEAQKKGSSAPPAKGEAMAEAVEAENT